MNDFRRLSERIWASPQIGTAEIADAARLGFAMILNNRPDGEMEDQPSGAQIAAAADAAGLAYRAIPVTHAGFNAAQVEDMGRALDEAAGPILAFCRSGTRSTWLWALAEAAAGADPDAIAEAAGAAGYDVASIRAAMDQLATNARA